MFSGVEKGCIRNKWVKLARKSRLKKSWKISALYQVIATDWDPLQCTYGPKGLSPNVARNIKQIQAN